ncbi:hypothetical protein [Serinibacter arcticus]|uniref:hypothetical protein n=1 Tax=Serinibacter arcticus TaxID=1655435 RepID=UPI001304F205|nr:hypothetical protein [Serinibacter arcticus]
MIALLDASVEEVLSTSARIAPLEQLLDDVDLAAAAARRRPQDRRRTLAGRVALRLLVSARTGWDPRRAREIVIDRRCPDCGAPTVDRRRWGCP